MIKDDWSKLTTYERYTIVISMLRLLATLGAPFIMLVGGYLAKHYLGW